MGFAEVASADPIVTTLNAKFEDEPSMEKGEKWWSLRAYFEGRQTESRLKRAEPTSRTEIQETELEINLRPEESLDFKISVGAEQFDNESQFYLREAYVDYKPLPRWFTIRAGQMLMNVGLLNQQEQLLSFTPAIYERLWTFKKGTDVGTELEIYPFPNQYLVLQAGFYSGRLVRPGDARMSVPDLAPRQISLRSRSSYHEAFLTHYEQELAYLDPVVARGVGAQVNSGELLPWGMQAGLLWETWQLTERQIRAPDQTTWGHLLFPTLSWDRWLIGYVYSESHGRVGSGHGPLGTITPANRMDILRAQVTLANYLRLQVDSVLQSGPEPLRDAVVGRLIFEKTF